ncbi:MAG: hypothetical protein NTX29_09185 [Actinobacteria bacterium]|nr:hypothetical protein [Actinomycetota bacterium]
MTHITPVDETLARTRITEALGHAEELCEAFQELGEQPGPAMCTFGMAISFVELDDEPGPEDIVNTPCKGGLVRPMRSQVGVGERVMLAITSTDSVILTPAMLPHVEASGCRMGHVPTMLDAGETLYPSDTAPMRYLKLTLAPTPLKPATGSPPPVLLRTGIGPDDVAREPLVLLCVRRPPCFPP